MPVFCLLIYFVADFVVFFHSSIDLFWSLLIHSSKTFLLPFIFPCDKLQNVQKTSVRADFQHPQPGINSCLVFVGTSLVFFVHAIFPFFTVLGKLSKYVRKYSNGRLNAAFYRFPVQLKDIMKQIWTDCFCISFCCLVS